MVEVRIPRSPFGDNRAEYVAVNGRSFLIPRGQAISVPAPIAEVVRRSFALQEAEAEFMREIPSF